MDNEPNRSQPDHEPKSLGAKLAPLLGGGFFRPLSRSAAAIYVDCAERLAEAADDGGQIPHDEARVLTRIDNIPLLTTMAEAMDALS